MAKQLTEKQQRFVDEYVVSFNATQSYILAGYDVSNCKKASIHMLAYKLLHTEPIQKAINERLEIMKENRELVTQKIARKIADILDGDEKTSDKLRAMELLMKMYSIGSENVNVKSEGELTFNIQVESAE